MRNVPTKLGAGLNASKHPHNFTLRRGRIEVRKFTRQGVEHVKRIQHPTPHCKLWRAIARRHGARHSYYSDQHLREAQANYVINKFRSNR